MIDIKVEKINQVDNQIIIFLAKESLKLFLQLNPDMEKAYRNSEKARNFLNNRFIEEYQNCFKQKGNFYATYIDGKIEGAAYIDPNNYLHSLFVNEKFRNYGIGSCLLETLIRECNKLGVITVSAHVKAISLYKKFNFHPVGKTKSDDFISMELGENKYAK